MSYDQATSDTVNALLNATAEYCIETLSLDMTVEQFIARLDEPLFIDSRLEYVRAEDKRHPDRLCAWCFLPRSHPDCNFAKGHTPYREMFGAVAGTDQETPND